MEKKYSADPDQEVPPLPIKTYQWEDLKRARERGGYPWTHLIKPALVGEITAEDILRESTPRRSASRDRSHTPAPSEMDEPKLLKLSSSPGSCRRHGEDGEDSGTNVPNFSKEISTESEEDNIDRVVEHFLKDKVEESKKSSLSLSPFTNPPRSISPKGILKRNVPPNETTVLKSEKTKCCHPLVNKIKHITDKKIQRPLISYNSLGFKKKKSKSEQEIRNLKSSPTEKRKKFAGIKLGSSDEVSKSLNSDFQHISNGKKEHIYEDVNPYMGSVDLKASESLTFSPQDLAEMTKSINNSNFEEINSNASNEKPNCNDKESIKSGDPSWSAEEDECELRKSDHIMEALHRHVKKEALLLDDDHTEHFEDKKQNSSPNITITEIVEDDNMAADTAIKDFKNTGSHSIQSELISEWSKSSSDHEYETVETPIDVKFRYDDTQIINERQKQSLSEKIKTSENDIFFENKSENKDTLFDNNTDISNEIDNEDFSAQILQQNIEERFFMTTPSSTSRTECEVSTSQVDSSALENLPLKRESRIKNVDGVDSKLQQRIKEQTGKLRNQAGKIRTKLQNLKNKQAQERPRLSFPDMPKFSFPDRRKFSFPERARFRKNNDSEKIDKPEKKRFSFPDRPKFSMPEMPKFKVPERVKLKQFGKKKEKSVEYNHIEPINSENITTEFVSATYPRALSRKSKTSEIVASTPDINYPNDLVIKTKATIVSVENVNKSTGLNILGTTSSFNYEEKLDNDIVNQSSKTVCEKQECKENWQFNSSDRLELNDSYTKSLPNVSSDAVECPHVINEINKDEFFVRPRGISRENINVRQYLNDEIREAFRTPVNTLETMGSLHSGLYEVRNETSALEADPGIYINDDVSKHQANYPSDDGYYTFPPIRPYRQKRQQVKELPSYNKLTTQSSKHQYDSGFSNVDQSFGEEFSPNPNEHFNSFTLPSVPKRNKKRELFEKNISLSNLKSETSETTETCTRNKSLYDKDDKEDPVFVYRTEHKYSLPESDTTKTVTAQGNSPMPPKRKRIKSRTSHFTDDDRTSHGAESLTSDPQISNQDNISAISHQSGRESPGYATVDKYTPSKCQRKSKSKTPPTLDRRSKSHERNYFTVDRISRPSLPTRPPRKKSSTSLLNLGDFVRGYSLDDVSQYVEIQENAVPSISTPNFAYRMRDRPLPPPPRPPRVSRSKRKGHKCKNIDKMIEVEVSTQTDPLPDDVDFELGYDETFDISISSSIRDIGDEEFILKTSLTKLSESPRHSQTNSRHNSRPNSRSETKFQASDPKRCDLAKAQIGRSSPSVILVERRVSSPTRINERDVILTEASLTVQPIDLPLGQSLKPLPSSTNSVKTSPPQSFLKQEDDKPDVIIERNSNLSQLVDTECEKTCSSENEQKKENATEHEKETSCILESESEKIAINGSETSKDVMQEIKINYVESNPTNQQGTPGVTYEQVRSSNCEDETRTEHNETETCQSQFEPGISHSTFNASQSFPLNVELNEPPTRPPLPEIPPLFFSYMQELSQPHPSFFSIPSRERTFTDFFNSQSPPPPARRGKRKHLDRARQNSESSSDEKQHYYSHRRPPPSVHRSDESLSVTEAGAQFLRACHNSVMRSIRGLFYSFMSYISGTEDKKDVQMALVIFLVLIAGLIMFGLSDGRTVHHHHWEFFNPPDNNK